MLNALAAERIKFFSTRGWMIGFAAFAALALLLPMGDSLSSDRPITGYQPFSGVLGLSLIAAMVIAATSVTQEYRYKTVLVSHQAQPGRWQPLVAKAVISAAWAALLTALMGVVAVVAVLAAVPENRRAGVSLANSLDTVGTAALTVAIMTVLAVGVGAVVRSTPLAVTIIVLWQTPGELILSKIPVIGKALEPYFIFNNTLMAGGNNSPLVELNWGQWGAMAYLAVVALVGLTAGLLATNRRTVPE